MVFTFFFLNETSQRNIQRNFSLRNRLPYAESANLISNLTIVRAEALHMEISGSLRYRYLDLLQRMTVGVFRAAIRSDLKISLHLRERILLFSASFAFGIVLDQFSAIERAIEYFFGRLRCSRSFTNERSFFEQSKEAVKPATFRVSAFIQRYAHSCAFDAIVVDPQDFQDRFASLEN